MRRVDRQDEQRVNDTHEHHRLRIGEVSKRSGMGIEALRFYERGGLLERPPRTESGYRVYDGAVLERLAFIKQAQVLGFSLYTRRLGLHHSCFGPVGLECGRLRQSDSEK